MALTLEQLQTAVRAGDSAEEREILTRLLAVGTAHVERHAPDAPAPVKEESVVRVAGYLFDMPNAGRGIGYASALRNSGAASLLLPWRVHRAGSIGEVVAAAAASGSPENPVIGLSVLAGTLTVTYADGTTAALTLPAGTDEAAVQALIDAALATAREAITAQIAAAILAHAEMAGTGLPDTAGRNIGDALTLADGPDDARVPTWSAIANPGFFLSGEAVPGDGLAPSGGHYLRIPADGPELKCGRGSCRLRPRG